MKLACMLTGHHWQEDPDAYESFPEIRCTRCGKHREISEQLVINPEASRGAWYGRYSQDPNEPRN